MSQSQFYVYYRLAPEQLQATAAAVHRMQASLREAKPGLLTALLRRPGLSEGQLTLMETYAGALPTGFEPLLAQAALDAGLPQPRHVECFEPLA